MRGGEKDIVEAGGCKLVMAQVKLALAGLDAPTTSEVTDAPSAVPKEATEELLRDALNASLNLSGAKCAQQALARHGLSTLVTLLARKKAKRGRGGTKAALRSKKLDKDIAAMASAVLSFSPL